MSYIIRGPNVQMPAYSVDIARPLVLVLVWVPPEEDPVAKFQVGVVSLEGMENTNRERGK